jgi:hypothetical protein
VDLHLPSLPKPGLPKALQLSNATAALESLALFLRATIAEVGDSLAPLLHREGRPSADSKVRAQQVAAVITTAAAPFAQNAYARARLLRQMHASGLLTRHEAQCAVEILDIA